MKEPNDKLEPSFLFYELSLEYLLGILARIHLIIEESGTLWDVSQVMVDFRDGLREHEKHKFDTILDWYRRRKAFDEQREK